MLLLFKDLGFWAFGKSKQGGCKYFEDYTVVGVDGQTPYFAVLDGHGGQGGVSCIKNNISMQKGLVHR